MESQAPTPRIYSVNELTLEIQGLIEKKFDFVWLEGEISNFSAPLSGHYYMVLKDDKAQIKAVMFRPQIRYLRFMPENGMKILARGRIGIYAPRGEYQLVMDYLEPLGAGALAVAFEQLKKKLAAEGLFDKSLKRTLPFLPRKVAVITSPSGAAIKDFLKVLERRFTNIEVVILPARVQGEGATADIIHALELANRTLDADVIVLTRGGGSLEDLWAFNEEDLARAIRRSRIPVVSAVGHEIDLTISDMAADVRASTPSAAAEMLVKEKETLEEKILQLKARVQRGISVRILAAEEKLDRLAGALRDPRRVIQEVWLRLDELNGRMILQMRRSLLASQGRLRSGLRDLILMSPSAVISEKRGTISLFCRALCRAAATLKASRQTDLLGLERQLSALNPMTVLKRGYSIALGLPERNIIRSSKQVKPGQSIEITLASGSLLCRTIKIIE